MKHRILLLFVVIGVLIAGAFYYVYTHKRSLFQKLEHVTHRNERCKNIVLLLQKGLFEEAVPEIVLALREKSLRKSHLHVLCNSFKTAPLSNAFKATKAILKLEDTGLNIDVLFPIAFFKETHFKEGLQPENYIPESRFGRELQYDPTTGHFFIHLGTHDVKRIGKGRLKVVTKTILYNRKNPCCLARAIGTAPDVANEIESMKALKGKPGLISSISLMHHIDPRTGNTIHTLITPIYNKKSLQKVLDTKSIHLSFDEKLDIARQIITGLASMHEGGYTHRDLGARNYFIAFDNKKEQNRNITCVIADFGCASMIRDAHAIEIQGNGNYFAPEGIFVQKMHEDMYKTTDLFAVGCVFWQLYFGTLPPWCANIKHMITTPDECLTQWNLLTKKITEAHLSLRIKLDQMKNENHPITELQFLKLILRMTNPDPSLRPAAIDIQRELTNLH